MRGSDRLPSLLEDEEDEDGEVARSSGSKRPDHAVRSKTEPITPTEKVRAIHTGGNGDEDDRLLDLHKETGHKHARKLSKEQSSDALEGKKIRRSKSEVEKSEVEKNATRASGSRSSSSKRGSAPSLKELPPKQKGIGTEEDAGDGVEKLKTGAKASGVSGTGDEHDVSRSSSTEPKEDSYLMDARRAEVKATNTEAERKLISERLKMVTQVNKQLHGELVNKRQKIKELRCELEKIENLIWSSSEVLEPGRTDCIEELDVKVQEEQTLQQLTNLELGNMIMMQEEKVNALSAATVTLKEQGKTNRQLLKDLERDVIFKRNMVQQLQRHVEIMETEGSPSVQGLGPSAAQVTQSKTMPAPGRGMSQFITDNCATPSEFGGSQEERGINDDDLISEVEGDFGERRVMESALTDGALVTRKHHLPKEASKSDGTPKRKNYKDLPGLDLMSLVGGQSAVAPSVSMSSHSRRYA